MSESAFPPRVAAPCAPSLAELEATGTLFDGFVDAASLSLAERKQRVRRAALQIRETLPPDYRQAATADLAEQLYHLVVARQVRCLAVYLPWRGEPDLQPLWTRLVEEQVQLALPVVTARASALAFRRWRPGDALQADLHGLPVPTDDQPLCVCDAMVIPCIAARRDGYRLGSGGGYYDRTLADLLARNHGTAPWTIGLVFSRCVSQSAWFDDHDIRMDCIVADRVR